MERWNQERGNKRERASEGKHEKDFVCTRSCSQHEKRFGGRGGGGQDQLYMPLFGGDGFNTHRL